MVSKKKNAAPKKKTTAPKKVVSKKKTTAKAKVTKCKPVKKTVKTTAKKNAVKSVVFKDGEATKAGILQRSLEKKGFVLTSMTTSTEWDKHGEKVVVKCTSKTR